MAALPSLSFTSALDTCVNATSTVLGYLKGDNKSEQHPHPLTFIFWLALLKYEPPGSKLWMSEYTTKIDKPTSGQWIKRAVEGQGKDDLKSLGKIITTAIQLKKNFVENNEIPNKKITKLFSLAIEGLQHLQKTYGKDLSVEAISSYIKIIQEALAHPEEVKSLDMNMVNKSVMTLWTSNRVKLVYTHFMEMEKFLSIQQEAKESKSQLDNLYLKTINYDILSIENYLKARDDEYRTTIVTPY